MTAPRQVRALVDKLVEAAREHGDAQHHRTRFEGQAKAEETLVETRSRERALHEALLIVTDADDPDDGIPF